MRVTPAASKDKYCDKAEFPHIYKTVKAAHRTAFFLTIRYEIKIST